MRHIKASTYILLVTLWTSVVLGTRQVYAHGFGERYDLPVPLNYFLAGAGITVALSFVFIGLYVKRSVRKNRYRIHNLLIVPYLSSCLTNSTVFTTVKIISVALFSFVILTAIVGTDKPTENFSPTFIWIIWSVGMGYVSAFLGNLWMIINPWKIIFEWGESLAGITQRGRERAMFPYPKKWDVWPSLVLLLIFAWLENVYSGAAIPFKLGMLILIYSLVTWAGMIAFGKHRWLRHGEVFSVLFGIFARFSPTETTVTNPQLCVSCEFECSTSIGTCVDCYRCFERSEQHERRFNIRPYAVGLLNPPIPSNATTAFVILALATVTFDGLTTTAIWLEIQNNLYQLANVFGNNAIKAIDTMALVLLPMAFWFVYLAFCWAIKRLSGDASSTTDVARGFVYSLIPIALAYNLAHYVSLLAFQGQLIIPLSSDPFGFGWDLLGTADYRLNIRVISAKFVWFLSVVSIVVGHVIAVYISHVISLRRTPDRQAALLGQYPMLGLMVGYTATSLWIIAQPIVN